MDKTKNINVVFVGRGILLLFCAHGEVMGEEGHVWKNQRTLYQKGSRSKRSEREMKRLGGKRAERETERERENQKQNRGGHRAVEVSG